MPLFSLIGCPRLISCPIQTFLSLADQWRGCPAHDFRRWGRIALGSGMSSVDSSIRATPLWIELERVSRHTPTLPYAKPLLANAVSLLPTRLLFPCVGRAGSKTIRRPSALEGASSSWQLCVCAHAHGRVTAVRCRESACSTRNLVVSRAILLPQTPSFQIAA